MDKHTAVYARVSKSRGQDLASQWPDLKRWARQLPDGEPVVWYEDTSTGTTMERPGFSRLMAAVEGGEVSRIVVWRLDRLGRTAKGLTALFEDLTRRRVDLVSVRDGLDLSTPAGRLMANVLASVAAYETEVRAERIHAGIAAAKAAGKTWGGSTKGRHRNVSAEQEETIYRLADEGKGPTFIARAVGVSKRTVYQWLARRAARTGPPAPGG